MRKLLTLLLMLPLLALAAADLEINTPAITALQSSMQARHGSSRRRPLMLVATSRASYWLVSRPQHLPNSARRNQRSMSCATTKAGR